MTEVAEAALELPAIVGSLAEPVFGCTLDGTIRSWNRGAEEVFGYRAGEIVGRPVGTLVPPGRAGESDRILERLRLGETIRQLETVRRRKDGSEVHVSLTVAPVRDASGRIVGVSTVAHELGDRERREEVKRFLAEVSRLLAIDRDPGEALRRIAALTLSVLADWCVIETADADGSLTPVAVAYRDPAKEALDREIRRRHPADSGHGSIRRRVLATGTAELIPEVSDALLENISSDADHLRMLRELGARSLLVAPLRTRGRSLGTILLATAAAGRRLGADDLDLAEDLARRVALAIDNAALHRSEQEARRRAELLAERIGHLQAVTAALSGAATPAEVAEITVTQGIASIDADAGALYLVGSGGDALEVVCAHGSDPALVGEGWRRLSTTLRLPSTDALHGLEPVFVESAEDVRERYPHLPGRRPSMLARAGAHVPLVVSGQPLGVLFLGFTRPRRLSEAQRSFVLALGRQCAQALRRAQLYEEEIEARSRLNRLVERMHEGVVSVDRRGRVELANSTARRMLAAPLGEGSLLPRSWHGFALRRFAADLFGGGDGVVEATVTDDERERAYVVTGIPAARSESVLLVIVDVSARERQRRAEREFVANAAHELRTPLAAITSAIERLQAGAREVPERRDRFLGHIQRESARLNRLASSLLVLARAQAREEEPRREEIELRPLVEELFGGLELARDVELVLDLPDGLVAHSNRDLLEHVLLNLTENAVRHTRRGRISVRARVDGADLIVEVGDTGPGIEPEELGRLFDRFYRGSGEEPQAGFGLGLPIAKEATQAIGGRIELESTPGEGTTARIVLPHEPRARPR